MKVGLTFACMNLKKLAKMIARKGKRGTQKCLLLIKYTLFEPKTRKNASGVLTKSVLSTV